MKIRTFLLVTLCAFNLTACACPVTPPYQGTPYDGERTAGPGFNEDGCLRRALPRF